jgi:hypothetical protein
MIRHILLQLHGNVFASPSLEVGPFFVQFAAWIVLLAGVLTAGIAHHQIAIAPVFEFIYGFPFLAYVTSTFHVSRLQDNASGFCGDVS